MLSPAFLLCGGKEKEQCSIRADKAAYARGRSILPPPELARTSHGVLEKRVSFKNPFKVSVSYALVNAQSWLNYRSLDLRYLLRKETPFAHEELKCCCCLRALL